MSGFSEEMIKDFFTKCDKDVLNSFIYEKLNILSETEKRVLCLKYCEKLPMKCAAADIQRSERYTKALHKSAIEKALPVVYCFVLQAFSKSLMGDD